MITELFHLQILLMDGPPIVHDSDSDTIALVFIAILKVTHDRIYNKYE